MPSPARLSQYLPADHITVPLRARTFRDAVAEMIAKLVASGAVRDPAALDTVMSARAKDVVEIGRQIALPHFRTDAVDGLVVALGIAREPLDAGDSGLHEAPRIVALVIAPPEAATLYLQTVAALARFFQAPDVVRRLYDAASAGDVVQMPEFRDLMIQPRLTVRALMMRNVTTVSPDSDARSAVDIMVNTRQRALPVVGDAGEVLGVVTEWDILRALVPHIPRVGEEFDESENPGVRDFMTRSVLCVPEEMGLEEAVNLMINKKVEHCPVVRDSAFVGMLTRADIIRKLFAR